MAYLFKFSSFDNPLIEILMKINAFRLDSPFISSNFFSRLSRRFETYFTTFESESDYHENCVE